MTSPEIVTDLLVRLRAEGIAITELSVQKPTLDEVFLTLTGRPATEGTTEGTTEGEDADTPPLVLESSAR